MLRRFWAVKRDYLGQKEILLTFVLSCCAGFLVSSNGLEHNDNSAELVRYEITPAFTHHYVVKNQLRELQIHVELLAEDKKTIRVAENNIAEIRDKLYTLFGSQDFLSLMNVEGRNALRAAALLEVQSVLQKEFESQRLNTVLFLSFVAR